MSVFEVNDNQTTTNYNCVLIAENGSNFQKGQKLRFNMGAETGLIDPNGCYLQYDLIRSGNGAYGSILEPTVGGSAPLRDVFINAGDGTNLEELLDYNVYVSQKLNLSNDIGYKELRNCVEGCLFDGVNESGDLFLEDIIDQKFSSASPNTPLVRKLCVPFHGSGLLGGDTVVPVVALNGLRIDIQLDDSVDRCMRASEELVEEYSVNDLDSSGQVSYELSIKGGTGVGGMEALVNCPFAVGDKVSVDNVTYSIKSIAFAKTGIDPTADNCVVLTFNEPIEQKAYSGAKLNWEDDGTLNFQISNPQLVLRKVVPNPQYLNAMMKSLQGKGLSFDIKSWNNLRNSISADSLRSSSLINSFHTRALALLSVPQPQDNTDLNDNSLRGQTLQNREYVYNIDGKQMPSRRVPLNRFNIDCSSNDDELENISNDVEAISETDKAWRNAGVVVRNLKNQQYNISYSRSLSNYGGSMNLVGKNPQLQIDYNSNTTGGKVINTFVSHLRNINISPSAGITVST